MKIHYCDLCDCPIHGDKCLMLLGLEEELLIVNSLDLSKKLKSQDVHEICGSCKNILDRLFSSRKKSLTDLVKNIEEIFKLDVVNFDQPEENEDD